MSMFEMYIVAKLDMVIPRSILYETDIKKIMRECKTEKQFQGKIIAALMENEIEFFAAFFENVKFKCCALLHDDSGN